MTHNAAKYEELRREFLQASADYDAVRFRLSIEQSAEDEQSLVGSELFDIPCHAEWPFGRWRDCKVVVPCTGEMAEPYSRLKELSANAWVWLPEDLKQAVEGWIPANESRWWQSGYQPWLWLLWACFYVRHQTDRVCDESDPGPAGADIEPFYSSAKLILDWGLNQDVPTSPEWLLGKAGTLSRVEQPAGKSPETKTKRSTVKGEAREKIIAALTLHHKYHQDESCLNQVPVGVKELARQADVAPSSVTAFFNKKFNRDERGGHKKYIRVCREPSELVKALKAIRNEYTPDDVCHFGRNPPGEGGNYEDRE